MAKAVPLRFVETQPNSMPKARPASPPMIGMRGSGIGSFAAMTAFIACTV